VTGDLTRPSTASGLADDDLERILAHAGAGAFVVDPDERILLWNQAAERIMGYAPRELIGRRCCDVFGAQSGDGNRLRCRGCHTVRHAGHSEPIQTFEKSCLQARRATWGTREYRSS
jgi:PAS domain S-box-containing protein